jgi:hypothetical protein
VPQAAEFQVASRTVGGDDRSTVAANAAGDFVIAWQRTEEGGQFEIFARRFTANGVAQAAEFRVNSYTPTSSIVPEVAMNASGAFVVAWRDDGRDGDQTSVFARRFSSSGAALGEDFQVNSYTPGVQNALSIGIDDDGGFVVVWEGPTDGSFNGAFARRFDASGSPLGPDLLINQYVTDQQHQPAIVVDGDGDFVVAWQSSPEQDGSDYGVFARRFDGAGAAQTSDFQVNGYTPGRQVRAAVAGARAGSFVVVWTSSGQDGDKTGVFGQRFTVPKTFDIDGNGVADALTDGLLLLRYMFGFRGNALIGGALAGNCTRCIPAPVESYLGGLLGISVIKPAGADLQANSYTPGNQSEPALAADSDGDFVLVWHSAHEGSSYGVLGRRFSSAGAPIAGEFLINSFVTDFQGYPAVAMDGDGDFVVAWESARDGSFLGVFGGRFTSSGVLQASEFQVNVATLYAQRRPAIAMNASGSFVVAWQSYAQDGPGYGGYWGVFARRFNSAGAAQATELQVNSFTPSYQTEPAIGMGATGAFVVVWTSYGQDGDTDGVFGRRFDAAGAAQATEFQVNVRTQSYQEYPAIDVDVAGNFVVAWESYNHDGEQDGIFVRRFNAAGAPQTGDVQANVVTAFSQYQPAVAIAGAGEFVVSWTSYRADGSGSSVLARRFDSGGTAQSTELQVNGFAPGYQYRPVMSMESSGDLVAAWQSGGQDGSGGGVFARQFVAIRAADIDGNGVTGPLTDGLLILRYLFGFRGAALITGATAPDCTRCTAPQIESWIAARV